MSTIDPCEPYIPPAPPPADITTLCNNLTPCIDARIRVTIASQALAEAGTNNTFVMSPLRTAQYVTARIASQVQAEAGTDNITLMTPLRTAQGATALITARIASQVQAEAGTDNVTLMTPLRTAQGATALITARIASQAQAEAGTDNVTLMTPLRTAQGVATATTARLASQAQAEAGTDNITLMTPLRTAQAIVARTPFASQAQAEAGTDNATVMSPLRSKQQFIKVIADYSNSALYFGLVDNDTFDNSTVFASYYNTARLRGMPLLFPRVQSGKYRFLSPIVLDQTQRFDLGMTIEGGGGWRQVEWNFVGLSPLQTAVDCTANHAVPPANLSDWYSLIIKNLCIRSEAGVTMSIGKTNFTDPPNALYFENVCVFNPSTAGGVALRLNNVYNSVFNQVFANCYVEVDSGNNIIDARGVALQIRQGGFNKFTGAFGNAAVGVLFDGTGIAFAQEFDTCTFENVRNNILNTNPNSGGHLALNCMFSNVLEFGIRSSAGNGNGVIQVIGGNTSVPNLLLHPTDVVGVRLDMNLPTLTAAFPATGVPYVNRSGRAFFYTIVGGGTLSNVEINGFGLGTAGTTGIVRAGDTFTATYTGSLSWQVREMR